MHTKLLVVSCLCSAFLLCQILLHANKTHKTLCGKKLYEVENDFVQVKPIVEQSRFMPSLILF